MWIAPSPSVGDTTSCCSRAGWIVWGEIDDRRNILIKGCAEKEYELTCRKNPLSMHDHGLELGRQDLICDETKRGVWHASGIGKSSSVAAAAAEEGEISSHQASEQRTWTDEGDATWDMDREGKREQEEKGEGERTQVRCCGMPMAAISPTT